MSNQSTTNLQGSSNKELSTCQICGHNVPTSNLILHEANCNRSSSTPSRLTEEQQQSSLQQNNSTQVQQQQIDEVETVLQTSQNRDIGQQIPNANDTSNNMNMSTSYASSATSYASSATSPMQSPNDNNTQQATSTATSSATANTQHDTIQLSENQWQCTRCTLINEQSDSNCAVCLAPRSSNSTSTTTIRPPDQSINQRLVGNNNPANEEVVDNGWVNVTYNPQFQQNNNITNNNGWVQQNSGRIGRILNGFVNGAVVGSFFAGASGIIVGGIAGAVGGALVDRTQQTEDVETRNTHDVANMLATDNGGLQRNTMRVHRSSNYLTAVSRDRNGRNRIIRVRYGGNIPRRLQPNAAAQSDLERSLLEVLVNMSNSRDFGGPPGYNMNRNNIILQPEQSFEELIQQFGMGTENRGASQEVIDSYPVEVVRKEEEEMDIDIESESESIEDDSDMKMDETNANEDLISLNKAMEIEAETSELGTCGICLEDYKEGEVKKNLSCKPMAHSFHSECIDKWLKQVASCPTCKHDVSLQT